jgi:hypothetical protein
MRTHVVIRGHIYRLQGQRVRELYMCPHTTKCVLILLYVSSYYYICVLILLHMCPHRLQGQRVRELYVSSYYYMCPHTTTICVLILLHMCPHTTTYVSSYYYICVLIGFKDSVSENYTFVLILLYVSSYYYICVLILLHMCPHRLQGQRVRERADS